MDKRIVFSSVDTSLGQTFAEAIDVTPRGGGLEKIAGEKHPEVVRYLRTLRPDPAYQYVLMTPMGSYEYWGMNVNGDIFPDIALSFDLTRDDPTAVAQALEERWLGPFGGRIPPGNYREFGHKTFLQAERYRHHQNKDPSKSYGSIVLAVWNPAMHRVEVVVRHDREKAKQVGAEEIVRDLDAGKARQISMGCKVPFDTCSKCGNISRTPKDYCRCLQLKMGSIDADGSINGAVNFFPRFFDLSDVFVPAAKESGVLMKVASSQREMFFVPGSYFEGRELPSGAVPVELDAEGHVVKVASVKTSASDKQADITKELLPNTSRPSVSDVAGCEPDIPKEHLRNGDLGDLLTTLAGMGIILKPHEFQQASLPRMGLGRYSDELDRRGMVFSPERGETRAGMSADQFKPRLAELLSSMLGERSGFSPHLPRRVLRVTIIGMQPNRERAPAPPSEPLRKVAQAYDAYRTALRDLPDLLDVAIREHPQYYSRHFFSELLTDSMEKVAGSAVRSTLSPDLVPLYVYSAYRNSVSEVPPSWDLSVARHSPARALIAPTL